MLATKSNKRASKPKMKPTRIYIGFGEYMFSDDEVCAEDSFPLLFRNGFQNKMIYNTRRSTSFLI